MLVDSDGRLFATWEAGLLHIETMGCVREELVSGIWTHILCDFPWILGVREDRIIEVIQWTGEFRTQTLLPAAVQDVRQPDLLFLVDGSMMAFWSGHVQYPAPGLPPHHRVIYEDREWWPDGTVVVVDSERHRLRRATSGTSWPWSFRERVITLFSRRHARHDRQLFG